MLIRKVILISVVGGALFGGYLGLNAWNARLTPEKIAAGKVLFEHEYMVGDSLCGNGDGLGPVFNAKSCAACHFQGGLGGSSGNRFNVVGFELKPQESAAGHVTGVVHKSATEKSLRESKEHLRTIFPLVTEMVTVTDPGQMYGANCESSTPATQRKVPKVVDPLVFHQLNSPALFGVGLIDDISELSVGLHGHKRMAQVIGNEFSGDFTGNRIGMVNRVDGRVGKFGWKGQFSSLENFVASACAMEIGLANSLHSQPVAKEHRADKTAELDMTRKQLHELVCFVKSLPRPEQVLPIDPQKLTQVMRGQALFELAGCADCHIENFSGIPQIYSDFHLYNLEPVTARPRGEGYSDGKAEEEFDFDRSHPHPDQWQTPCLWGVADSAPYFHDGGSRTLQDAIFRHKGQAKSSYDRFTKMPSKDQDSLVAFLKTLKAPIQK